MIDRIAYPGIFQPGPVSPDPVQAPPSIGQGQDKWIDIEGQSKPSNTLGRPRLNPPPDAADMGAASNWLRQWAKPGPSSEEGPGTRGVPPPSGENRPPAFDFSSFQSDQTRLLVQYLALVQKFMESDQGMKGLLGKLGFQWRQSEADAIKRAGVIGMSSSIATAAVQTAVAGVGAQQQLKGLSAERNALKFDAAPQPAPARNLPGEAEAVSGALPPAAVDKAPAALTAAPPLAAKPAAAAAPPPQADTQTPAGGNAALKPADGNAASAPAAAARDDARNEERRAYMTNERLKAEAQREKGRAVAAVAGVTGGVMSGTGRYAETIEQARQRLDSAASQTLSDASASSRDHAARMEAQIQELLREMAQAMSAKAAAVGSVASNLRA
ncbi:Invasin IpaC [Pandoraea terrae]|uniref:Effector protein BipC n=1 Tax=Pandoraea terrae TaxID=1537710 RepID=A0A5E4TBP5_9BURK|nr:IpaC/SipC family type III secretion system effector [Pandoraea terrae]VVD84373.1 Invasin IpaC [Pandoraea terrae]